MKRQDTKSTTRQRPQPRQRRLEALLFAPEPVGAIVPRVLRKAAQIDPDAWVDNLTDGELGDLLGASWREVMGRSADHLVPEEPNCAA